MSPRTLKFLQNILLLGLLLTAVLESITYALIVVPSSVLKIWLLSIVLRNKHLFIGLLVEIKNGMSDPPPEKYAIEKLVFLT